MIKVGGTGTPVVSCGSISANYTCNVTGTGSGGNVTYYVTFVDSSGTQLVYSATQASNIAGGSPDPLTIAANASSTNPNVETSSHTGNSTKTTTLTFGPYTLKVSVGS
jgi:hypothetical protein